MKSYKEFTKQWRKHQKEKKLKFSIKGQSEAWNKYKENSTISINDTDKSIEDKKVQEKNTKSYTKPQIKSKPDKSIEEKNRPEIKVVAPSISVEPQSSEITNLKEVPEASNVSPSTSPAGEVLTSPAPLEQHPIESYLHLATAVHLTAQNIIKFLVPSVNIADDSMKRLNNSGALLIQKYDRTGAMQKFGHEMAYVLTLLDISTQVYVKYAEETKKKEESEDLEKTEDQPEKPSEVKADFFKDTTSRGIGAKK